MRANDVRTILDFGFTKSLPLEELVAMHDYAIETQRSFPDAIFGLWLQIDPRLGEKGAQELERCMKGQHGIRQRLRLGLRHGLRRQRSYLRAVL